MELKIGELAKMAGVNIQTVRYYERCGLLKPSSRLESGYRLYDADALKRLKFIRYAKELGFTLKETDELLGLQVNSTARCEDVRLAAKRKVAGIDSKIEGLQRMRSVLTYMIGMCRGSLTRKDCPILDSIANPKKEVVNHETKHGTEKKG